MKVAIFIPTYNESENIEKLLLQITSMHPGHEVIVVDDSSPDGTGERVRKLAAGNPKIHLFTRTEKRGRGFAGIFGYGKSLEMNADFVIEMDADLSHSPGGIAAMLDALRENDVVIGSRYVPGGKDTERNFIRKSISFLARNYIRFILGLSVKDPTSGFRAFRRAVLEDILPGLKSRDPFIVTEVLYRCEKKRFRIAEIPISFNRRYKGKSKLGFIVLLKYLYRVFALRYS